ncbi:hypothetical protein BpHYR1_033887 [Brachionus plicatilis]|uniref:Uncharacterized protein n=1 Tax=Brachionus plicatilis TaxID=10195 RepID=A0A3M7S6A6_BRAPC|nr:hypothetical protein BpHYR1_033887 [Brachionus plicatilis]
MPAQIYGCQWGSAALVRGLLPLRHIFNELQKQKVLFNHSIKIQLTKQSSKRLKDTLKNSNKADQLKHLKKK